MKFSKLLSLVAVLTFSVASGCAELADGLASLTESASNAVFLVSSAATGSIQAMAQAGSLLPGSTVTIKNITRGQQLELVASDAGSALITILAQVGDKLEIRFTNADGSTQVEESTADGEQVSAHGLLTKVVVSEDQPPCWVLIRDDLADDSTEPQELLLVPPGGHPHHGEPHEEGDGQASPPPQGEEGEPPPPHGEGDEPPPPQGDDQASPPPQGEGEQPPPKEGGCHGVSPETLEELNGSLVTVAGSFDVPPPPEDASCSGTAFALAGVVADE